MSGPTGGHWVELARKRSTVEGTCWIWNGTIDQQGYAKVKNQRRTDRLHHLVCKEAQQPVKGMRWVARHLCGNKACVNPDHLEAASHDKNMADERGRPKLKLPDMESVRALAANLPAVVSDVATDQRAEDRRERLVIDQTTRGGSGVAEQWYRVMTGEILKPTGQDIDNQDVLLLSIIARKKRELSGKPEPADTGLLSIGADKAAKVRAC